MGELRSTNNKLFYNPNIYFERLQPQVVWRRWEMRKMGWCQFLNNRSIHDPIQYFYIGIKQDMIRQLNKVNSASKLEEAPSTLAPSSGGKFRRTNKKQDLVETNTTSEKTESLVSQETPMNTRPITRTNRLQKKEESRSPSQIEQLAPPLAKGINSRIKTQPDEVTPRGNFIKKININLNTTPSAPTENQIKPMKPALSPRTNLATSPPNNSQQQIQPQQSEIKVKINLKKGRLLRQKIAASFKTISDHRLTIRAKYQKQATILGSAASAFAFRMENKVKNEAFNRFKMIAAKQSKQNFMIDHEMGKINEKKRVESLINYLNLLFRNKIRSYFVILNKNRVLKQILSKSYPTLLDFYEKRKVKQAFETLKRSINLQTQRKTVLLGEVQSAFKFCSRMALNHPFIKISLFATSYKKTDKNTQKKPSNQSSAKDNTSSVVASPKKADFQTKKQKLAQQMQKIQKQSTEISQKMIQKKRSSEAQSKKLKKTMEQLTKRNTQAKKEVDQKKTINNSLKKQSDSLSKPQLLSQQIIPGSNPSLSLLQQLYSEIYKAPQAEFSTHLQKILKDYHINPESVSNQSKLIQQWILIGQKQSLQRQIDLYECSILGQNATVQSNVGRMMREQSCMVIQMIKNYIRQRYLWGEVQKFVATVL